MKIRAEQLLSITKAAKILGVHPLTLRSWAEKGHIPFYKTPGGHRRFKERDLLAFLAEMNQEPPEPTLQRVAHQAVQKAITTLPEKQVAFQRPVWQLEISEQQREAMRSVGQKLLGLTIQYVSGTADKNTLEKACRIGQTYGRFTGSNGMSLSDTVATFNFFRDTIIEATFDAPANAMDIDASNPQLYWRLNRFFNDVLLATVQAAESAMITEGSSR